MAAVMGAENLIAKLQTLRKTRAKAAIRKGSKAAAKISAEKAKDLVPVKTGALKKAIKVRALKRSRKWTGSQVTTKVADGPTFYGSFVNYGTKRIKARRFLNDAAEQTKASATEAFVSGIESEIARSL